MKQPNGNKKRKIPDSKESPAVSYTPEQRRMVRNGLRIWARVAIRSYLRQHAAEGQNKPDTEAEEDNEG